MHDVELADIQGNILRGYNQPLFRHLCFTVRDWQQGQRFLQRLIPRITTAEPWGAQRPASTLNVHFTCKGLAAMGMQPQVLISYPFEFQVGMKERAEVLVDLGDSAPEHWDPMWRDELVHMMVSLSANGADERERLSAWVMEQRHDCPQVLLAGTEDAGKLVIDGEVSPKEHFGYTDGIGNPDIDGVPGKHTLGGGKLDDQGNWQPIAPGEFLLGYRDEADEIAPIARPERLFRNGTFMVFRKLEQRVPLFREYTAREGAKYPGGEEMLKAKLVGRWQDGTPIELSPNTADAAIVSDPSRILNFTYGQDLAGKRCPVGAHIRRANPRDTNGFAGRLSNRHRILRRGVTYGSYLPPDASPEQAAEPRGLLFIAFNASIERQFEFVQQQWMNFGNDFRLGNDKDPIIGNRVTADKMVVQGDVTGPGPYITEDLPQFVVTRGGDYFFTPSLSGCRLLASADATLDPRATIDPELPPTPAPGGLMHDIVEGVQSALMAIPGGQAVINAMSAIGHDFDEFLEKAKAWALAQNPEPVFAILRAVKPIVVTDSMVIITKCEDAQQVLSYPTIFTVPYAAKFAELCDGGGFFLGWDDTPQYTHDLAAMRLVVRREDIPTRIAPFVSTTADAIVAKGGGRLDVVQDLGNVVPTEFVRDYMVPLPGENATLASQAADISAYLFLPVGNFRDGAMGGAVSLRGAIRNELNRRKQQRGVRDDVLERCLTLQDHGVATMDDDAIVNNIFGMVVGAIPTTSAAVARTVDELLRRPEELALAQAAARDGDIATVTQYVFEAMRFNPIGPGVFRVAQQDFIVAGGSMRETMIPAGRNVLVALQSASFDGDRVPSPDTFSINRPLPEYLHFGFGLHTCFGRYINTAQIPRIVMALLRQRNLRRADGEAGTLQINGPFPSSFVVEYDA